MSACEIAKHVASLPKSVDRPVSKVELFHGHAFALRGLYMSPPAAHPAPAEGGESSQPEAISTNTFSRHMSERQAQRTRDRETHAGREILAACAKSVQLLACLPNVVACLLVPPDSFWRSFLGPRRSLYRDPFIYLRRAQIRILIWPGLCRKSFGPQTIKLLVGSLFGPEKKTLIQVLLAFRYTVGRKCVATSKTV